MYVAEVPQEPRPYGRWEETLRSHFLVAAGAISSDEEIGEPGTLVWFPERTWNGRTYVPVTAPTSEGSDPYADRVWSSLRSRKSDSR